MSKIKKVKLEELKVQSFVTLKEEESGGVKGGALSVNDCEPPQMTGHICSALKYCD